MIYMKKVYINESQESKSQSEAIKLVMSRLGYDYNEANSFVRNDLRNDIITSLSDKKLAKFTLGVTRMYCDGQIRDARTISDLNATLKLLSAHLDEYDRNLNGISANDLIQRFAQIRKDNIEQERNDINNMSFGETDYDIVRIDSFEDAQPYYDYTNPNSRWCLTYREDMFDKYSSNGVNQIYFCLKDGFENVPCKVGANAPLDEYGLSMLSIIVNENGELAFCTTRWNHKNGGSDSSMSAKEVSEVIGVNFYEVFKPNGKWNELLQSVYERLQNGESPSNIFDSVYSFSEGFARVNLNGKYNFINTEGKFLSKQWFDWASNFIDGLASVQLNDKFNFINTKGEFISEQWFDWVDIFYEGFAIVELNGKYNFINTNGELLSEQWFDNVYSFSEGFALVVLNGKKYYIDKKGQLYDKKPNLSESIKRIYINENQLSLLNASFLTESKNIVKENLELEVEPNEVDLSSFEKQSELNPHFWKNYELNPKVRFKLLDIAEDFYRTLNIKFIKPIDIIMCGSMCNYNWSSYSDVDLHILIDFNEITDNSNILKDYFDLRKNEWNNEHTELNIYGYKVELYVQDINDDFTSSGIYSLEKNEWINKPSYNNVTDLSDKRQKRISKVVADIMTQIDDLYVNYETYENDEYELSKISNKIDKILKNLKHIRKNGLQKNGELSLGNIVYKAIRRADYFNKLWELKVKIYDKINSIE